MTGTIEHGEAQGLATGKAVPMSSSAKTGEARSSFSRAMIGHPRRTGAIAPSSYALAERMAEAVDPARPGPVVELGPGTGVITRSLIRRGVSEDRLILIEAGEEFAATLAAEFPRATVITGNAFEIKAHINAATEESVAAIVSGLPLLNRPRSERVKLVEDALELVGPDGIFVQFSYHIFPPVPRDAGAFYVQAGPRVWRNLPPARVWIYRQPS